MQLGRREIIEDFEKYCEFICPDVLVPQISWYHRHIMKEIKRAVDEIVAGAPSVRLAFMMPPRHWKTLIGRDWFMSYMFGRFPDKIGVYATYNEDFAAGAKDSVGAILASDKYKWLFPDARTRNTADDFDDFDKSVKKSKKDTQKKISNVNATRGEMNFVGRGNSLTGIGSHYSVLDDPYKDEEEGLSEKINASILGWFSKVFLTREEVGNITLIFYTRWISNDVIGGLETEALENTDPHYVPFRFIRFAAEKDVFEHPLYDDSMDPRADGEPLNPSRVAQYAAARKDADKWAAMYQQMPLDKKGRLFNIGDFGRYAMRMRLGTKIIVVDANAKEDSKTVDCTGIQVWGRLNNKSWLIELINKKMNYPELKTTVAAVCAAHPDYHALIIEDASNGVALIQDMRRSGFRRVVAVEPQGAGKRQRASLVIPVIQSGGVMLPSHELCYNISDLLVECSRFTGLQKGEKDDQVDCMVMALNYYEQFSYLQGTELIRTVPNPVRNLYDQSRVNSRGNSWPRNAPNARPQLPRMQ